MKKVKGWATRPALIPVEDPYLVADLAILGHMHKCFREYVDELNRIDTEMENRALRLQLQGQGESGGIQGVEVGLKR